MPHFVDDFVDDLERELANARRDAAAYVDRAEALAALHSHAVDLSARLQRPLSADDLFRHAKDENERAQLQALTDRVTRITRDGSGLSPAHGPGGRLDTGAEL